MAHLQAAKHFIGMFVPCGFFEGSDLLSPTPGFHAQLWPQFSNSTPAAWLWLLIEYHWQKHIKQVCCSSFKKSERGSKGFLSFVDQLWSNCDLNCITFIWWSFTRQHRNKRSEANLLFESRLCASCCWYWSAAPSNFQASWRCCRTEGKCLQIQYVEHIYEWTYDRICLMFLICFVCFEVRVCLVRVSMELE